MIFQYIFFGLRNIITKLVGNQGSITDIITQVGTFCGSSSSISAILKHTVGYKQMHATEHLVW